MQARLRGSQVVVEVHPSSRFEGPVIVDVEPMTASRLVIDREVTVGDRVRVNLRGGQVTIGAGSQVRRFVTINAGGVLTVGPRCVLSQGLYVHCTDAVTIGADSILGENVTVADSNHVRTDVGEPIHHAVTSQPVRVGSNVWVGASALIAAGVTIGDQCVIGGGSVVTTDVPDWWLAGGNPARALRRLEPGESFGSGRGEPG